MGSASVTHFLVEDEYALIPCPESFVILVLTRSLFYPNTSLGHFH